MKAIGSDARVKPETANSSVEHQIGKRKYSYRVKVKLNCGARISGYDI